MSEIRLSKSSVLMYESCPFRYYLLKICRIKEPKIYAFERGIEIHESIYKFLKENVSPPEHCISQVAFVKASLNNLKPYEIIGLEGKYEASYKDLKLVGIIDLLVKHKNNLILFDYKTGKDRGLSHHRFELALYVYILNQNGIHPTHWGIMFVDQKKVYVEKVREEQIKKSLGKTYDTYLLIKSGHFPRKKSDCSFCPFRDDCDTFFEMYKSDIEKQKEK